ncbi:MAG: helicase-exonuclease AddAB subunit AddA [Lachnospiraceae bacterium]|nr:helicase-exonuclease AddAB subunit AddA [Lachnospiraceae bacterium]
MAETRFTEKQQTAIDIRERDILVSAAAGSGKTAVLVQRIIDRILDENNPIDIDRILVMTFTRAAAAQMKERILDAINKKKSENPQDKNLSKQYALVHNAYIMTIDSFCMNVVRNHFGEIGLSPDFRIADEGEITLLQQDVLAEVIEEAYESSSEEFLKMTEIFASKKTDTAIEKLVLSLYNYAASYADPFDWLEKCIGKTTASEGEYEWLQFYVNLVKREFEYYRSILDEAADICDYELGPRPYKEAIESDITFIDSMLGFNTYDELYQKCVDNIDYSFEKLGRVAMPKGDDVTEAEIAERTKLKERVKEIRDKCKESINTVLKLVSTMSLKVIKEGQDMMAAPVEELVNLTISFFDRFNEKKRDMNIVDFNDIEHMCLEILKKGKDTTALEYKEFFEEIYIDEYQDSNFVQEEIVNLIAKHTFMVGDVKQSIYGFRNAKPEIFIEKYERFSKDIEDPQVRIDLSHNFRSRGEVLISVNNIFRQIMTKEYGGIAYDDDAALYQGREFKASDSDYTTELNLFISNPDSPDKESEALMVANRIKNLMKTCQVEDPNSETGLRPLRYSDIVILLRTTKDWDNVFQSVLDGQGIPVFVATSTGYFETYEVRTLLNFLKIIDNPLQDIPLASVMMSVIGNFFEEEVAVIRATNMDGYLYEALESYDVEGTIYEKVKLFKALLSKYRRKAEYTAVSDILTEIIDSEYGKIIKAMPGGQKKYANLNMLLKKAMEYGKTSYKGIFQFNRYIEAIRKYDIDFGEANLSDETDNAVRIMSIHKSKGLEFPVCFLSGMSKKFNTMDANATVLTDSKYGIATDIIDISRRIKSKSMLKVCVAKKKRAEIIAEELRLLYVAMTRAKEKLILTGTVKSEDAFINSLATLDNAANYLDMVFAASDHGKVNNVNLSFVTAEDLIDEVVEGAARDEISRRRLIDIIESDEIIETEKLSVIRERINYRYPHIDRGSVKLSVSELKHMSEWAKDEGTDEDAENTTFLYDENGEVVTECIDRTLLPYEEEELVEAEELALRIQAENREKENKKNGKGNLSGALHGSAVHRVFELWDYNRPATRESVQEFITYIKEELLLEEKYHDCIRVDEILDFLNSEIAARMKNAFIRGELYREQPFVISNDENDPESMLIQGVIDAYFIEDGEIVVVDYKTDKATTAKKLKKDHGVQLDYYGKALSRLLHLNLRESVIYSTFLGESITI